MSAVEEKIAEEHDVAPSREPMPHAPAFTGSGLFILFGQVQALRDVYLEIRARNVTAIIGPSGCGKSTFLRALNRMHDLVPSALVEGDVRFFGQDIYAKDVEPVTVRRRIG